MEERLNRLEVKIDYIIELLKPINEHAPFVDDLKKACQTNRILKSIITVTEPLPPQLMLECND